MTWTGQYSAVGATHTELMGGRTDVRFRPKRVSASELDGEVRCRLSIDGEETSWLKVYDISPTGVGVQAVEGLVLAQGTNIERLVLELRGAVVFEGEAAAVYQLDGPESRLGLRFSHKLLDLRRILLRSELIGQRLGAELHRNDQYRERLSSAYRAGVADLLHLLQQTKLLMDELERAAARGDWWEQAPDLRELVDDAYERWGPRFHGLMGALADLDAEFDDETREIARSYATDMLMPLLYDGPLHRRSYDKPRGYAGDYKVMTMCFAERLLGDTWWGKFLHNAALHYPMVETVPAREANMRGALHDLASQGGSHRIITLACGPALEVNRFIREVEEIDGEMTFYLIDQDKQALEYAHDTLNRALAARGGKLPVTFQCLHFSIKQLLRPETDAERAVVHGLLNDVDLVYSAGLMDYLPDGVARALIDRVYALLKPGGRLFIGNLKREPLTAWLLESVLAWHLEYRDEAGMNKLTSRLAPVPSSQTLQLDETGYCMFLDVRKPTD